MKNIKILDNPDQSVAILGAWLRDRKYEPDKCDLIRLPLVTSGDVYIRARLEDQVSASTPTPPYKSFNGYGSHLLEGSEYTVFTYKITGLSQENIDQVNALDPNNISARIALISSLKGKIQFHSIRSHKLLVNLETIDSHLGKIISYLLLISYLKPTRSCSQLLKYLYTINPLDYPALKSYDYKLSEFLVALIIGFCPIKQWSPHYSLPEGYQYYTTDNDMYIFYIDNHSTFESLLVDNTTFSIPSPTDCDFGYIYTKNQDTLIDLGLEINFINVLSDNDQQDNNDIDLDIIKIPDNHRSSRILTVDMNTLYH